MKTNNRSHQGGFTILESLVSFVILVIGLLGVLTMLDISYSSGTLAANMTSATETGQWMMDRIRQDSMSLAQPFSADVSRLSTFDNDSTGNIILDTDNPNPAATPGLTAFQAWVPLVQSLPNGRGVVTIVLNDPANGNNHTVNVSVNWRGVLRRGVVLETIIAR